MAANPFIGLSEAQLLEIRTQALADVTAGKVTTSAGVNGKSFGKSISMSPEDRLRFSNDALRRLNPTTYGRKITRTHASIIYT